MKKLIIILCIVLVIVVTGIFVFKSKNNFSEYRQTEDLPEVTELYFLDVGQGDSTFIEFKNGTQALVDCGKSAKVLEELGRVMDFRDKSIDYLIITHPDNDHYGGCIDVLERFDIANVVYNGQHKNNDEFWNEFWRRVKKEGSNYHVVKSEEKWFVGDDVLHFLYPDGSTILDLSDNNKSIVFILESAGKKVLFTGDMEDDLEVYLVEKFGEKLDVDILKVGHHGSGSSSIDEFVDKVSPIYSIIPVGENKYGHPSLRVMRRLERSGSSVFRTDLLKGVKILLDEGLSMDQIK